MKDKTNVPTTVGDANHRASRTVPLYLKVADYIRHCIENDTLANHVLLTESHLSTILGISRTPARQALQQLAKERLIIKRKHRGYLVGTGSGGEQRKLMPEMLKPESGRDFLHPSKAWEDIYEKIENEIIRLSIISSWRINAQALAKSYGCSRNAIQDVLTRLEAIGLVAKSYQSRWTITPLDEPRLNNIFDVRSWLEPNLLAQAAPNIPPEILTRVIEQHQDALSRFPQITSFELNGLETDLHERLQKFADNRIGMVALKATKAGLISSKHIVASKELPLSNDEPFIKEHLAILEALQRKNIDESRLRMQAHLLKSREKVLSRLKQFRLAIQANSRTFGKSWAIRTRSKH